MRKLAIIILLWPIFFFCAGVYEMKKAKETADWPGRRATITAADVVEVKESNSGGGSRYLSIRGLFLDTGTSFTVKRYAYGAVNGLSPRQKYLAPYKPGYMTTVYVDPADAANVILCNTPSLTGNYVFMGGSAFAVVAILWWLMFKSRKTEVPPCAPRPWVQNRELPRWAGVSIGLGMALLFLGLGIWIIYMGMGGHSPAETWTAGQAKVVAVMGMLFTYGGVICLVQMICRGNPPPLLNKIMRSIFFVFLGLPFVLIPILDPGGISSSSSVNGFVVHKTQGSSVGAVVFMITGVLCLVAAFWPWRWWKKR